MRFIPRFRRIGFRPSPPRLRLGALKFFLASLGLLLVSFALAFYLFFPTSALKDRIEQEFARQTGGEMKMSSLSVLFPAGLQADRIVITGLAGRDRIDVSSLSLRPAWRTLAGTNPGFNFLTRFQGGVLEGSALKSGALEARANRVAFDESLMPGSAIRISGNLERGEFSGETPIHAETETRLNLVLRQVLLTGMEGLGVSGGNTSLGTITLNVAGKGNAMRIESLSAEGGALEATGSGSLILAQPTERSRINLTLTLRPGADLDPNLRDLLTLFAQPTGDGNFRLRLTGTLAAPIFAM
jgi:type II secretion system protein N